MWNLLVFLIKCSYLIFHLNNDFFHRPLCIRLYPRVDKSPQRYGRRCPVTVSKCKNNIQWTGRSYYSFLFNFVSLFERKKQICFFSSPLCVRALSSDPYYMRTPCWSPHTRTLNFIWRIRCKTEVIFIKQTEREIGKEKNRERKVDAGLVEFVGDVMCNSSF